MKRKRTKLEIEVDEEIRKETCCKNKCQGCGYPIAEYNTYWGECTCEEDME